MLGTYMSLIISRQDPYVSITKISMRQQFTLLLSKGGKVKSQYFSDVTDFVYYMYSSDSFHMSTSIGSSQNEHNSPRPPCVYLYEKKHTHTKKPTIATKTFPTPSQIPLHNPHRRHINLPPLNNIIPRRPQKNPPKHDNIPIHRLCHHRRRRREKTKHKQRQQKHKCDGVDGRAPASEGPTRGRERFAAQTFGEDAADGENVGAEEGGEGEGDDGVEGDGGTEVYEADYYPAEEGDYYCVEGDGEVGGNL